MKLTRREIGTVLAALRLWQQLIERSGLHEQPLLADIATDGDTIEPLDADEIEALCEALNLGVDPRDELLANAASMLKDLSNNWPTKELTMSIEDWLAAHGAIKETE